MNKFIFETTGLASIVKFEELGAYFNHPVSGYTLSDYFNIEEIRYASTVQSAITSGEIIAYDEYGSIIYDISYLTESIPVFSLDEVSRNKTYIGYGTITACKINEIITSADGSYTSLWAGGTQSFDKIWANRSGYTYF